jgi:hypothetical protein
MVYLDDSGPGPPKLRGPGVSRSDLVFCAYCGKAATPANPLFWVGDAQYCEFCKNSSRPTRRRNTTCPTCGRRGGNHE